MIVIDTNILLHAANLNSREHKGCFKILSRYQASSDSWYLTWSIVYEFLSNCSSSRVFPRPWSVEEGWKFIENLFLSPSVGLLQETKNHSHFAKQIFQNHPNLHGAILHDTHTAILMRENGIRKICTLDSDFHRFEFLEVVDPFR